MNDGVQCQLVEDDNGPVEGYERWTDTNTRSLNGRSGQFDKLEERLENGQFIRISVVIIHDVHCGEDVS